MKKLLLSLTFAACSFAQTASPALTLGTPVKGEYSASIPVSLSGATGLNVAALQFTPATPAAPVTMTVTAGAALTAAQKQLVCGSNGRCIGYGVNQTSIADGVVAIITLSSTSGANLSQAIADLLGATLDGSAVPMTSPGPVTVSLRSKCDLNGDGKTDLSDVIAAIGQAQGGALCTTADLTGRAKCDVLDVQRVVNAAAGSACKSGT